MGMKYIWDTNMVIYYLQQQFPTAVEKFIDDLLTENQPCISVITEIELLCWKTANEKDLLVVRDFINDTLIIELQSEIKSKTAEIRIHNRIKLPDAIIGNSIGV
jgi:predicted nucleic acid-binding protein